MIALYMSKNWMCVNFSQYNNCSMKESQVYKYFAFFYCKSFFYIFDPESQWKSKSKLKWLEVEFNKLQLILRTSAIFDLILKAYKSKGLYFIVCQCAITKSNLLECRLCVNVNLVLLWISSMLGTRWQCKLVFSE